MLVVSVHRSTARASKLAVVLREQDRVGPVRPDSKGGDVQLSEDRARDAGAAGRPRCSGERARENEIRARELGFVRDQVKVGEDQRVAAVRPWRRRLLPRGVDADRRRGCARGDRVGRLDDECGVGGLCNCQARGAKHSRAAEKDPIPHAAHIRLRLATTPAGTPVSLTGGGGDGQGIAEDPTLRIQGRAAAGRQKEKPPPIGGGFG